jgi:hypothetical protein
MPRLAVILIVVVIAIDIFAIVDLALTDRQRVRALNKFLWVLVIIIVPVIGAVLWITLGKDRKDPGRQQRVIAPDDDPSFLRNLRRDEEQDERIRRLEQELADLDDDPPKD